MEKMNDQLNLYISQRAKGRFANTKRKDTRPFRTLRKGLFWKHPEKVKVVAREMLNILLSKHKAKLEAALAKGHQPWASYYGSLVATATHMAYRRLGLIPSSASQIKKLNIRMRMVKMLLTKLGRRESSWDRKARKRIVRDPEAPLKYHMTHGNRDVEPNKVSQTDLTGI